MAKVAKITVQVEIDGAPVRGFPVSRKLSLDETTAFSLDFTTGSFVDLPISGIGTKQFVYLAPASTSTFQFGNGAAGNIQINSGGFLLLVDCSIATDIEAQPAAGTVVIDGQVGGT